MIIKVCGMRDPDNIQAVESSGADWIGFICYHRSPRFVVSAPAFLPVRAKRVGVFVNSDYESIINRAQELQLNYLQLHGSELPELCKKLMDKEFKIIKTFSLKKESDIQLTNQYQFCCNYFLFDTPCAAFGGSGKQFDWKILSAYRGEVPFLLSGGISPSSITALTQFHHPQWKGIDLNSGFEIAPGLKDVYKLQKFINQIQKLEL